MLTKKDVKILKDIFDEKLMPINAKLMALEEAQKILELKVETYNRENKKELEIIKTENKRDHEILLEKLVESNDIHWEEQRKLKKRVKRIEEHLHIPQAV